MKTQCPVCGLAFARRRKDQTYCGPNCRKAKYQRQKRAQTPANSAHSHSKRQDNELLFDRSKRLAEMYYTTAPAARLGVLKDFIDQARSGHSGLRQILTNKMLLKPPIQKKQLFYCNSPKS
ncbi:hypothetical protein MWU61_06860 [Loktanella sp. F6476L]|uniref:hypothetical protein n=1 Tax=Loktanella sp. F6476L TaxID=2926405 RepID=UPI001FF339D7|nr:hypothetical protein [Loktanella sp. F6476L]MCK0120253.1 hypothetical protein [Loktanella sp. F6476L]